MTHHIVVPPSFPQGVEDFIDRAAANIILHAKWMDPERLHRAAVGEIETVMQAVRALEQGRAQAQRDGERHDQELIRQARCEHQNILAPGNYRNVCQDCGLDWDFRTGSGSHIVRHRLADALARTIDGRARAPAPAARNEIVAKWIGAGLAHENSAVRAAFLAFSKELMAAPSSTGDPR